MFFLFLFCCFYLYYYYKCSDYIDMRVRMLQRHFIVTARDMLLLYGEKLTWFLMKQEWLWKHFLCHWIWISNPLSMLFTTDIDIETPPFSLNFFVPYYQCCQNTKSPVECCDSFLCHLSSAVKRCIVDGCCIGWHLRLLPVTKTQILHTTVRSAAVTVNAEALRLF